MPKKKWKIDPTCPVWAGFHGILIGIHVYVAMKLTLADVMPAMQLRSIVLSFLFRFVVKSQKQTKRNYGEAKSVIAVLGMKLNCAQWFGVTLFRRKLFETVNSRAQIA